MLTCHPKRSKHFNCICGKKNEWIDGVDTQACLGCQRVHARGLDGPNREPKECRGSGKKMRFSEAAWLARDEFLKMMYRCGYETNRNGRVVFTNNNLKKTRRKGFTVSMTDHFAGDGDLGDL